MRAKKQRWRKLDIVVPYEATGVIREALDKMASQVRAKRAVKWGLALEWLCADWLSGRQIPLAPFMTESHENLDGSETVNRMEWIKS